MCACLSVCLLCPTESNTTGGDGSIPEETAEPSPQITQNPSETEHSDQPVEEEEEEEKNDGGYDEEEREQEEKHKVDQNQEHNKEEVSPVQPQDQQKAVPDQDEAQQEDPHTQDPALQEEPEQVETFFSTMSHRYGNMPQEGHIL